MNLNLNLLVIIISLLAWTTPNFCPLTFVQANTLKALPSTPANLTKIITVVESASDKDIAGIKVLAKRFGLDVASASKAALLAKLRADLAELSGGGGGGGGGSGSGAGYGASGGGSASKPEGDINAVAGQVMCTYETMNRELEPLLATATVLENALTVGREYASVHREFLPNRWDANRSIGNFITTIKAALDDAERNYSWSEDPKSLTQIITINTQVSELPRMYLEQIYTITNNALDLLAETKWLNNISGINTLDEETTRFAAEIGTYTHPNKIHKLNRFKEAIIQHKEFVTEQIARDLLDVAERHNYIAEKCQNLLDELEPESGLLFTDSTLSKLLNALENIVKICLEKVRIKTFTRLDTMAERIR